MSVIVSLFLPSSPTNENVFEGLLGWRWLEQSRFVELFCTRLFSGINLTPGCFTGGGELGLFSMSGAEGDVRSDLRFPADFRFTLRASRGHRVRHMIVYLFGCVFTVWQKDYSSSYNSSRGRRGSEK